jgi:anaerobic selenocysteine-containing dehydrogenase
MTVSAPKPALTRVVRGACPHDCPDTCALDSDGRRRARRQGRRRGRSPADGRGAVHQGRLLPRAHLPPDRLLHPLRRVGPKGPGARFERISWDEALACIAERFRSRLRSRRRRGDRSLQLRRQLGPARLRVDGPPLLPPSRRRPARPDDLRQRRRHGLPGDDRASIGFDAENVVDARLIILWGSNSVVSNLHFWRLAQEARRRGARLIAIDPCRTTTAEKCDQHIALLPGTDSALALGLMHVLIRDDLLDHDYIARHTLGFDALRQRAMAYPPERVAAICGISTTEIEGLAHAYGSTRPAAIRTNYGINRTAGGGMALRTVACLPALDRRLARCRRRRAAVHLGQLPGEQCRARAARPDADADAANDQHEHHRPRSAARATADQGAVRLQQQSARGRPAAGEVVRGFARDDLFTVVHDLFQTDTADYADILLPATSHMEQLDIHKSYGHLYLQVNQPAIAPLGEALPNTELFRRLAREMGFSEACFADSDEDLCRQAFDWSDPRLAGPVVGETQGRRPRPPEPAAAPGAVRRRWLPDAFRQVRVLQPDARRSGTRPAADFIAPREWRQSPLAAEFPLALITPPARNFLNTSFANSPRFLAQEKSPAVHHQSRRRRRAWHCRRPPGAHLQPRGEFHARAVVTDRVRRASPWPPRSGGASCRPTGATATRSPARR